MPKNSSFISTLFRTTSTGVDKALSDDGVEDRGSKQNDGILKSTPVWHHAQPPQWPSVSTAGHLSYHSTTIGGFGGGFAGSHRENHDYVIHGRLVDIPDTIRVCVAGFYCSAK
jgi:hypothetical protein